MRYKYCDGKCIKKTCDKTPNQTGCTNGSKSCDDGCGGTARQCCVPCTDKITSKPANSNYTYSTCVDGEGSHQIQTGWTCISGYHTKDSGCEKDCNATNCSGYALTSCPANAVCDKCTRTALNCSTDGTKYKLDSCRDGYKVSANECVIDDPDVYELPVLYADLTVTKKKYIYNAPIGVVFDENRKLAVSLSEASSPVKWSKEFFDIPALSNYSDKEKAINDWNGKNNTIKALNYCAQNSQTCDAVQNAFDTSYQGTNKGEWYIPAAGEWQLIYTLREPINKTIEKLGQTQLFNKWYWSSTEANSSGVWALSFSNGDFSHSSPYKSDELYLRTIIDYGNLERGDSCGSYKYTTSTCTRKLSGSTCGSPIKYSSCVSVANCIKYSGGQCSQCASGYRVSNGNCVVYTCKKCLYSSGSTTCSNDVRTQYPNSGAKYCVTSPTISPKPSTCNSVIGVMVDPCEAAYCFVCKE